jgi:site-specific DNA-methyltransferase (adenine-specific)
MTMQLLHGDCLEVMKTLPEKSIDCFICDLPYGCLTTGKSGCVWDIKIDLEKFWEQVERLMKNDNVPILHFCNMRFGFELIQSKSKWFRYDLIWEKANAVGFLHANKQPLRAHEHVLVFSKKSAFYNRKDIEGDFKVGGGGVSKSNCYNGTFEHLPPSNEGKRCLRSVFKYAITKQKNQHPTEKPLPLYSMLIERYCPPEGTILDPTAGSFNSCFSAKELGRKAIGIEMNKVFYDKVLQKLGEVDGVK